MKIRVYTFSWHFQRIAAIPNRLDANRGKGHGYKPRPEVGGLLVRSELHSAASEEELGPLFITSASVSLSLGFSPLPAPLGGDEPLHLGTHIDIHRYHVATINRFWNQVSCDMQLFPL